MYLDDAQALLTGDNYMRGSDFRSCTPEEVRALEERIGHALPLAYKEFLLWIGHEADGLLRGSDVFYEDLPGKREGAEELLRENGIEAALPDDAFVFYMHQGYQFMFFRLLEGDNPPVYYYGEGEGMDTFRLLYARYSDFLVTEIEGHKRLWKERRRRRASKV